VERAAEGTGVVAVLVLLEERLVEGCRGR